MWLVFKPLWKTSHGRVSEIKLKERKKKKHIANELHQHNGALREAGEKGKLFTTREDCLVHIKLWPALHCLWCLSFNRLVDIMNEPDPPSATPERPLPYLN